MKKQIYTKEGRLLTSVETKYLVRLDGGKELNPSALSAKQLLQTCGLYQYEPPQNTKANGKPTRPGKLLFDDKKGTCTREVIELTPEEIALQEDESQRQQFEAEQDALKEAEKEQDFQEWKAKNKGKQIQLPN